MKGELLLSVDKLLEHRTHLCLGAVGIPVSSVGKTRAETQDHLTCSEISGPIHRAVFEGLSVALRWLAVSYLQVLISQAQGMIGDVKYVSPVEVGHVISLVLWSTLVQEVQHSFGSNTFFTKLLIQKAFYCWIRQGVLGKKQNSHGI